MTREILSQIYKVLDDKKGIDIRMIDIGKISSMADYFVIASANNDNQIQAMVDAVEENLQKIDVVPKSIEGQKRANWILMDYQDIVVHIFDVESRAFYDLDRIWSDGIEVTVWIDRFTVECFEWLEKEGINDKRDFKSNL